MARRFTIELLMDLAKSIGANPNKFMGTRTNVSFLGAGPNKNPLFQRPLPGLERATPANLGSRDALIEATEDAMSYATAGKLNTIQTEILGKNLSGIKNILEPPPLPMATISKFPTRATGIGSFGRDAKFADFFGYPRKPSGKRMSTGELIEWEKTNPKAYAEWRAAMKKQADASAKKIESRLSPEVIAERSKRSTTIPTTSMLPEPGPGDVKAYMGVLDQQTGMSRAIARNLLLKDTRLNLKPEDLFMLKEGKGEPLDMMRKYYGQSMGAYDDFLNQVDITAARPDEFAEMILKHVKLIPQFAGGGLAKILEVNDTINRYDLM